MKTTTYETDYFFNNIVTNYEIYFIKMLAIFSLIPGNFFFLNSGNNTDQDWCASKIVQNRSIL